MNIEEKKQIHEEPKDLLCVNCKKFFGNEAFLKMCSQCYKKHQTEISAKKQQQKTLNPVSEAPKEETPEVMKKEVNKDKCNKCSRKLRLLGVECRCGSFFCNSHRMPQDHACGFDHKNKERLTKQIIKVQNGKIQQI